MPFPKRFALVATVGSIVAAAAVGYLRLRQRDPVADSKPLDWVAVGKRFHRGPGPCLRYWKTAATEAELREVVDRLVSAGATCEGLKDGSLELVRRGFEVGAPEHAASQAEELAQLAEESLPWWGPLALRVQGVDLRQKLATKPDRFAKAAEAWAKVPTAERQALDDAWQHQPTVFVLANIVPLIETMNVRSTQGRLDSLAHLVEAARDTGRSESAAQQEVEALPAEERRDCWSAPIEIVALDGGLRLRSLGGEGSPGDAGADGGLERVVDWKREEPDSDVTEEVAAACGPIPASVAFSRSEIDGLEGGQLAGQARVLPFFENGQVIGFQLLHVSAGSVYTRLGLCDGDIVDVAGVSPLDPAQAVEALSRFRAGKPVELHVRRGKDEATVVAQIR